MSAVFGVMAATSDACKKKTAHHDKTVQICIGLRITKPNKMNAVLVTTASSKDDLDNAEKISPMVNLSLRRHDQYPTR